VITNYVRHAHRVIVTGTQPQRSGMAGAVDRWIQAGVPDRQQVAGGTSPSVRVEHTRPGDPASPP
jgi:hypothetical protein